MILRRAGVHRGVLDRKTVEIDVVRSAQRTGQRNRHPIGLQQITQVLRALAGAAGVIEGGGLEERLDTGNKERFVVAGGIAEEPSERFAFGYPFVLHRFAQQRRMLG